MRPIVVGYQVGRPASRYDRPMPEYLDTRNWPRRAAFEHFSRFELPFFSLCTRLDVAPLKAALGRRPSRGGLSLACHYAALRAANAEPAFRLRLEGPDESARVRIHSRVDASTTVLRDDESFGFATLRWQPGFAAFCEAGAAALQAVRDGPPGFHETPPDPGDADAALMYFTTLPWVHFTSFAHARPLGTADSVPRIAFGRIDADGARQWLPVALDVHHALMDGLHAGRYLQALEAAFAQPEDWLRALG
jgi:chloramphenicol O-acetyltransferase type A